MELRQVRAFLAIAEELHFGRAAARLHLAQSSVSEQLRRLERDLDVVLVDRGPRRVRLTAAGEAFRAEATRLVEQAGTARAAARAAAAGCAGPLSIGFNFPAGQHLLPAALARFAAVHPAVATRLWERRSGPQLRALRDGNLDVGFVYGPVDDPQLVSTPLLAVPVVAVVGRAAHPLASQGSVPMRRLAAEQCVLFRRAQSPAMHDAITGAARAAGVWLNVAEEIDDPAATGVVLNARRLVGFASAPRARHGTGNALTSLALTDPTPRLDVHVVRRRDDRSQLIATFVTAVCAVAAGAD
ncbi:LysR family transcriptional regulator [Pseudonocardia humida]|uniref:LysR family transcriptional regulator n=1 Tax=Pseudonocardia humida TaxID=2800819 RepID=A0ABT1A718_9PSEU|nr:LysR substrate-binding domain-containing protein [Pseudonocardia humida]MCO1658519.1 LysR family transcriptional regulator [Pseudonocardia humida]